MTFRRGQEYDSGGEKMESGEPLRRYPSPMIIVLPLSLIIIAALFFLAYRTNLFSQALSPSAATVKPDDATVNAIFGTIQFAVASVSGMIIIFGLVISASLGRSVTDARSTARRELEDLAKLYKESIESQTKTVEIQARGAVDTYLAQNDLRQTLEQMKKAVAEAEEERAKIIPLIKDYYEFKLASKEMEDDYVGPYLALVEERDRINQEEEENLFYRENRLRLRNALLLLEDGAAMRKISGNDAFNGAQMAGTLNMSELAHRLAVWASWLHPTALYQARVFRSEHERGERLIVTASERAGLFHLATADDATDPLIGQKIRERAYESVLDLLEDVPLGNCHLIYSEVWNVSIRAEALDRFIERCQFVADKSDIDQTYRPSYFYAQLARAYAILGGPDWYNKGSQAYIAAATRLAEESPSSPWYVHSINELQRAGAVAPRDEELPAEV